MEEKKLSHRYYGGKSLVDQNEWLQKECEAHSGLKHTPGPWEIEERTDKEYTNDPSIPQYRVYSAAPLNNINAPGVDYNIAVVDSKENARLIAAAPDLLEACQLLLQVRLENGGDSASDAEVRIATAAISKAEGRA